MAVGYTLCATSYTSIRPWILHKAHIKSEPDIKKNSRPKSRMTRSILFSLWLTYMPILTKPKGKLHFTIILSVTSRSWSKHSQPTSGFKSYKKSVTAGSTDMWRLPQCKSVTFMSVGLEKAAHSSTKVWVSLRTEHQCKFTLYSVHHILHELWYNSVSVEQIPWSDRMWEAMDMHFHTQSVRIPALWMKFIKHNPLPLPCTAQIFSGSSTSCTVQTAHYFSRSKAL